MRRSTCVTVIATGVAATAAVATTALALGGQSASTQQDGPAVILAHGADRHPAQTATDWVTYADHVVEVTPVVEKEIPPSQDEVDRGEGLILRKVTLRVGKVLWSSDTAAKDAPASFEWIAHGWQFTDGSMDNRTEMAGEGEPRVEAGHHYVMAIDWQAPKCDAGDGEIPGQWRGLGSESNIPYDNGVLGQGEFQGQTQSSKAVRAAAADEEPNYSLRDEFFGRTAEDLAKRLAGTEPGQPTQEQSATPNLRNASCG